MTKRQAQLACAKWLAGCLEAGWAKSDLDELEHIWWRHHDEHGNLRRTRGEQAPQEKP